MSWDDLAGQAVPSASFEEAPGLTVYFGDEGTTVTRVETVIGVFTRTTAESLLVIDGGDEVGILQRSDVDLYTDTVMVGRTVAPTFELAGYGAGDGASLPGEPDLQHALEALTGAAEPEPPEADAGVAAHPAQQPATGDETAPDEGDDDGGDRYVARVIPVQLCGCQREGCPLRVVVVVGAQQVDPGSLRCTEHPDEVLEPVTGDDP
jgi:hypothetical protein